MRSAGALAARTFFFNDTATTEIYTLSLHDALPIYQRGRELGEDHRRPRNPGALLLGVVPVVEADADDLGRAQQDRKSTRLNSSHANISYAVFCLKKKK